MALSYHVVLFLFLFFSFADVVLISVRTLVSRRYHSLTLCYALMAVQESILVFELLAVLGQVLSTYLVTASMWAHTASLLGAFTPLWLLRTFLTAFTVVYKDILLPRWSSAAASTGVWGLLSHASRAWRATGYGAVVSLDVACFCFYYLSAVYVLAYLSEKRLYVPYHRRRWRHLQRRRALTATAATAVADEEDREVARQKRWREERQGGARRTDGDGGGEAVVSYPTVMPLTRTPSFRQWEAVLQQQQQETGSGRSATAGDGLAPLRACEGRSPGDKSFSNTTGAAWTSANALQSPSYPTSGVRRREEASDNGTEASGLISNTVTAVPDGSTQPPSAAHLSSPEAATAGATVTETAAAKPQRAVQQHHGKPATRAPRGAVTATATTGVGSPRQPRPVSLVANLPPLQLQRRFTISNSPEEERRLHQFAAALAEHGYTSVPSQTRNITPELPSSKSHVKISDGVAVKSGTPSITEVPTAHEGGEADKERDAGNLLS
ncbi:hypothetical protein, unknown function [Leishmania infantum JPCM5]|uniref:Uncharacterized protein n=2 Tax=Leishmania infantum TaxID=5671 RepID=A4HZY9_LEIIN|nr:hypothetical protein, unknown function [Leishmania infantum JPCM5]CAC9488256.1 hypothetical_protein_-_conserved [Leishmania infantum]CAM68055.1 hypothetical protein, unknown function [Leishmania infantum JPCM5]SUZ41818.1 hypothetical_protein_-_conserved [Leishmania infantum]|eukprot:XP_001465630.1 hypothetical protein, unknown function [Leishmania infantum JPCM5]